MKMFLRRGIKQASLWMAAVLVIMLLQPAGTLHVKAEAVQGMLEGNAQEGYYINMPASGTTELIIPEGVETFKVYESGGKDSVYSDHNDGYLLLTAPEDCIINLCGMVYAEENNDYLSIYDGNSTGNATMGNKPKNGSPQGDKLYLMSSGQNQILLYFHTDSSVQYSGVDLTVCVRKKDVVYPITVNEAEGGYLEVYAEQEQASAVSANTVLTVEGFPKEGYELTEIQVTDSFGNKIMSTGGYWYTDNCATFVMPSSDVVITGIFTEENEIFQTIPDSGIKELVIAETVKKFNVYTAGGKEANYKLNSNGYLLLTAPEGYSLSLSGKVTTEGENYDYLTMYDGNSAEDALLGNKAKYGSQAGDVVEYVTSSGNQILLYFHSDHSNEYHGVELTVTLGSMEKENLLTVTECAGGTVKTFVEGEEVSKAKANTAVTIVGTPREGYTLTGVKVHDSLGRELVVKDGFWYTDNTASFVMPAMDVMISCEFLNISSGENEIFRTIPITGREELKIAEDVKSFKIYTSGGKGNGYANYCNGELLLTAPEGFIMNVEGTCNTENHIADYLTIYDGSAATEGAIAGAVPKYGTATTESINRIVSSGNQLLIYFTSDSGSFGTGADLTVTLSDLSKKYELGSEMTQQGTLTFYVKDKAVDKAAEFERVSAKVIPKEGYVLTGMEAVDGEGNPFALEGGTWQTSNTATFYMPDKSVKVYPKFTPVEEMVDDMYLNIPVNGTVNIGIPRDIRSFTIYDNGGISNTYSANCSSYIYLTSPKGYHIKLNGNVRTENYNDYLKVYDQKLAEENLLGQFMGPEGVVASDLLSTENEMILYFRSDGSSEYSGFELTVELVPITYEITYDLAGGELQPGEENPVSYTSDDEISLFQPVKDGYEFMGWSGTGLEKEEKNVTISLDSYGNRSYTAVWRKLITGEAISVQVAEQTYNGMFEDPVVLRDNGDIMVINRDYTVSYKKDGKTYETPVQAGTYEVTVTGIGEYIGTLKREYIRNSVLLQLVSLTAEDRLYDRTNQIGFTEATLQGIIEADVVGIDFNKTKGSLSSSAAGSYTEVTLEEIFLTGEDAGNYILQQPENPFVLRSAVTIGKAKQVFDLPQSNMKPGYLTTTVGQVKLPANWSWKAADASKSLEVSKPLKVTALYNGADKDNYESVSVVVTITRQPCGHKWDAGVETQAPMAVAKGKKKFTCTVCGGTKTEDIPALGLPKKGTKATDQKTGITYKVTKSAVAGGTVEIYKPKNKKIKSVTIPSSIKINGVTYKVTSIGKNAFSGCTRLTKVTIGKNISNIGAKAFYKCKKLKNITVKTTKLTAKKIGKQAFKGTPKKMTLKVPKKKLKLYKKIFVAKGVHKNAKFKK